MIRKAYLKKVEARLERLGEDIEFLKEKAGTATADARDRFARQVAELQSKAETAKNRIKTVRASGEMNWGRLKKGADDALDDLKLAVDHTIQWFRKTGSDKQ